MNLYSLIYDLYRSATPTNVCPDSRSDAIFPGTYAESSLVQPLRPSIQKFLKHHLKSLYADIVEIPDEIDFLQKFGKEWRNFEKATNILRAIFSCFNRVQEEKLVSNLEEIWRTRFALLLLPRLTSSILKQIDKQRQGQNVDVVLLQRSTHFLIRVGVHQVDVLGAYREAFERPFLKKIKAHYENVIVNIPSAGSIFFLMKSLLEEEDTYGPYLHQSTVSKISDIVVGVVMEQHRPFICAEILHLINDRPLRGRYSLNTATSLIVGAFEQVSRVETEFIKLLNCLKIRILKEGRRSIAACRSPAAHVEMIQAFFQKYSSFSNNEDFSTMLETVFMRIVNGRDDIDADLTLNPAESRAEHWLAIYCDDIMRLGRLALDRNVRAIELAFHFIDEKTAFENDFRQRLQGRLSRPESCDIEAENYLLQSLRHEASRDYSNEELFPATTPAYEKVFATFYNRSPEGSPP